MTDKFPQTNEFMNWCYFDGLVLDCSLAISHRYVLQMLQNWWLKSNGVCFVRGPSEVFRYRNNCLHITNQLMITEFQQGTHEQYKRYISENI